MTMYAADHADALATLAEAGAPVTFSFQQGDGTYLADLDFETYAGPVTVSGYAVRVKDEPRVNVPDTEQVRERVTLLFAPSVIGEEPQQQMFVAWGGRTFAVKSCGPVAPDGTSLLMRVKVAR